MDSPRWADSMVVAPGTVADMAAGPGMAGYIADIVRSILVVAHS